MTTLKLPQLALSSIKKQIKKPKDLPRPARVAMVKGLRDLELSIRKIAKITGLDKNTVQEYIDTKIDNKFILYQDAVKKIFTETNDRLKVLTSNAIENKLEDAANVPLRDITGLYKVLYEVDNHKQNTNNLTQLVQTINVHPALSRDKGPIKQTYNVVEGEIESK